MKKVRKLLAIVLVLAMCVGLFSFAAFADNKKTEQKDYPFVFVHGLMGWGAKSDLDPLVPYWGMTTGNLMQYLINKGYESYAAQVGPLSGAWDRACELYAQLTGTTVDYGIAHSTEKGHDRYGITYDKPLFEGWGADKKVNLIGHSFGGATIREFLEILANGSQAEVDAARAAGEEPSPFFLGGKGDWVYSLTAVAAPHNGTTFIETCDIATDVVTNFIYNVGASLKLTNLRGVYDLQLEHFGISRRAGETDIHYLIRVLNDKKFMSHNDNAIYDLTIDNALKINDGIEMQDGVYYFSVCGDDTHYSRVTRTELPNVNMFIPLKPFAQQMGSYYNAYTKGGVYIGSEWLPNDGMVNVISGLYPFDSNLSALKADGSQAFVNYDGKSEKNFSRGVWNVLPTKPYDHLSIVGGVMSNTQSNVHSLYLDLIDNIVSTYDDPQPVIKDNGRFPFLDVPSKLWSYDFVKQMFSLGVINGRDSKTFDPNGGVTRAEFVKMIACLNGIDTTQYTGSRFKDVSAHDVFAPYIEWAAENGIVNGYSEDEFAPNELINREQMAAIVCRYADYAGITLPDNIDAQAFVDEGAISDYALNSVTILQKAGILNGFENTDGSFSFAPQEGATRDQACKILSLI